MIKQVIYAICSAASITSLAFIPELPPWSRVIIFCIGILFLGIILFCDIISKKKKIFVCRSDEAIKKKMLELINIQGKICMLSRDLSWVDGEIEKALVSKNESMLIFAQHSTKLTKRLAKNGVKVLLYGNYGYEPKTRFTLVRYNREDPFFVIAKQTRRLGRSIRFEHKMYKAEISNNESDSWLIYLAMDLMELVNKVGVREE